MLEYLDIESRKNILGIIYAEYKAEKSKNVTYGIVPANVIADWENYRYKWIHENILSKLEALKNQGQVNG